ncbi:GPI ethanolamine phosphate transferase 2 [Cordyceps militaris]|uniref:GPI ethanolamine phosphate transferase 2 n=1 Tax=Cordyceps militaris TaxID=73501 RepID=A0A2H4S8Y9_CORMI|nr:GPI ethanolamine phosphate transferase 2 [Cordyceps militaris]
MRIWRNTPTLSRPKPPKLVTPRLWTSIIKAQYQTAWAGSESTSESQRRPLSCSPSTATGSRPKRTRRRRKFNMLEFYWAFCYWFHFVVFLELLFLHMKSLCGGAAVASVTVAPWESHRKTTSLRLHHKRHKNRVYLLTARVAHGPRSTAHSILQCVHFLVPLFPPTQRASPSLTLPHVTHSLTLAMAPNSAIPAGWSFTTLLLAIANLLIPVSILIFATGFFPYKPFLPGLSEFEVLESGPPPQAPFDKLVFVVIDALRSDFVYSQGSGFKYTQSLIRDGAAIPFTAYARSPTVTMPRLKAITTGSIPSFVDLILNIDEGDESSALAAQDTWLAQLKAKNTGKVLMYGDDTWLKLFPDFFDRHDGTSSFFVADFTEVDNNVTRHINGELQNDDWSLMVLHYLGLDHIGHKSGPRSSNMVPKQQEMDAIVRTIYDSLSSNNHLESTLLVVCGDHGMNDAGNHGASSPGETSPALLFLSPKLKAIARAYESPTLPRDEFNYYSEVEQSDIVPTVAALLGFPVSKNNLGAFIPEFLPFWSSPKDKIQILVRNARQILNIVTASFGPELFDLVPSTDPCQLKRTDISELACEWQFITQRALTLGAENKLDQEWLDSTSQWIRKAQNLMSSMASNYDMPRLYLGLALAVMAVTAAASAPFVQGINRPQTAFPLVLISLLYGAMMFASSYVEEEHHFWYWAATLWLAFLGAKAIRRSGKFSSGSWYVVALLAVRVMRSWNQTGQKFAGEPDIVKLFVHQYPAALWMAIISMYAITWFQMLPSLESIPFVAATSITSVLISSAFTFKLAFTAADAPELVVGFVKTLNDKFEGQSLLWRARVVFIVLGLLSTFAIVRGVSGGRHAISATRLLHELLTIFAMTQSRAANIPLFLLAHIIYCAIDAKQMTLADITTSSILFQHASFFAAGGSNAISSVDLSSAYNGIAGFNVVTVGILTFVSNWAGPLYWTSATTALLLDKFRAGERGVFWQHTALLSIFATASVAFVMAACIVMRTHLFIWTVFSPKYLYAMAWNIAQHLLVNIGLSGALFWLGTR